MDFFADLNAPRTDGRYDSIMPTATRTKNFVEISDSYFST